MSSNVVQAQAQSTKGRNIQTDNDCNSRKAGKYDNNGVRRSSKLSAFNFRTGTAVGCAQARIYTPPKAPPSPPPLASLFRHSFPRRPRVRLRATQPRCPFAIGRAVPCTGELPLAICPSMEPGTSSAPKSLLPAAFPAATPASPMRGMLSSTARAKWRMWQLRCGPPWVAEAQSAAACLSIIARQLPHPATIAVGAAFLRKSSGEAISKSPVARRRCSEGG
ncbi:hypothetical protein BU16DRAFT_227503 [Lophium mytilinum]|uniref:Uncharacterized protein n=1 Tax=Lophium mytilinum TaxID=390894 RepID=A0A6A6Q8U3_9PEZI|nr:hypothetical protein BU16DRAFT_227503 [Lophium mytilinum]